MKKKGQVTTFIIIGAIILLIVGGTFVVRNYVLKSVIERELEKAEAVPLQIKPVKAQLESCLNQITMEGVKQLEAQGGYIDIPVDPVPATPVNPFSNKLQVVPGLEVPYWFYETSNGVQKTQVPSKEEMQNQLASYINNNFLTCVTNLTSYTSSGYEFTEEKQPISKVLIQSDSVVVEVDYPLSITLKDLTFDLKKHFAKFDSSLFDLYQSASNILKKENSENFFDERTIDMLAVYSEVPFSGIDFDCMQKIWSKRNVTENLKRIISTNIAFVVVKGTQYTLLDESYKYFEFDAGRVKNANVNFMYSPSWPITVDITPSDGDLLKSDTTAKALKEVSSLASLFCVNTYNFIYDVKYPILATLTSQNGEVFNFATMVIIKNNQPKQNKMELPVYETQPVLCENPVTKTTVYTLAPDENGILKDVYGADVSFKCFSQECPIGKSDLDEIGQASLTADFPACINGAIIAEKEGYYKAKQIVSTNYPSTIAVVLEPFYKNKINIKVIDKDTGAVRDPYSSETVIVELKNKDNDYSTSLVYPSESNEIDLVIGNYNIKSYIIANSTWPIQIEGQKITKCIKTPTTNILGLFFEQERCIDTDIPDIFVNQIIKGGASFDFNFERSLLASNKEINIYTMADRMPTNYSDLSLAFESIDKNKDSKYFRYPE